MIPAIIGLASLAMGAYQMAKAGRDKKKAEEEMKKAMAQRQSYKESDASKKMLADAEAQLNATSPAVTQAYDQAQKAAAATRAQATRNATSGADALAMGSISQGQLQSMVPAIAAQQEAIRMQNRGNYYNALTNSQRQEELVAADNQARYSDLVNISLGKMGAANAGITSGANVAASGLMGLAGAYANGNMTGLGKTNTPTQRSIDYIDPVAPSTMQPLNTATQPPALARTAYGGMIYDAATNTWKPKPLTMNQYGMYGRW